MPVSKSDIPLIDISPLCENTLQHRKVVDQIGTACREIGFICINGTGISPSLILSVRKTLKDLFQLDEHIKYEQAITRENYRGFIPINMKRSNCTLKSAKMTRFGMNARFMAKIDGHRRYQRCVR